VLEYEICPGNLHVIIEKEQYIALGCNHAYVAGAGGTSAVVPKVLDRKRGRCDGARDSTINALVHNDNLSVLIGLALQIGNCPAQEAGPVESGDDHGDEE